VLCYGDPINQSGNPAAISSESWDLGQWLCVPLFRGVCLYLVPERKLGFFVKIKEDKNFNHRHTLSISRINPPKFGGGLKFESDPREIGSAFHGAGADIGEKDSFRSGTI
jgi:hypothetical protein